MALVLCGTFFFYAPPQSRPNIIKGNTQSRVKSHFLFCGFFGAALASSKKHLSPMERNLTHRQKRILQQIASLANDSRKGYLLAVENIFNTTLKEIFLDYSTQRVSFAIELKKVVGHFHVNNTYGGLAHRAWMVARYFVTRNDYAGTINDCIVAEKYFLKFILKAEKMGYPEHISKVISQQKREVVQSIALLNATLEFLPAPTVLMDKA
jgi:hypothetical protein